MWSIIEKARIIVRVRVIVCIGDVVIVKLGRGIVFSILQLFKYIYRI